MILKSIHFYKSPGLIRKFSKDLAWSITTKNKEIYLSFDDGPIPGLTEDILKLLQDFHAKATFFCVGDNIRKHPDICAGIVRSGHTLGNHTFNHLKGWKTANNVYFENIERCNDLIACYQKRSGTPLFRPPYGQITFSQIKRLKTKYKIVMWDTLAYDFSGAHTAKKSLDELIKNSGPGSIVVFHDNYKAEVKLKYMLPRFLDHFGGKGFHFKAL